MPGPNRDVDAIFEALQDERAPIFARLREIIHAADPDMLEVVKWRKPSNPLGAAVFEHDGIVCLLVPLKGRVRMSFGEGSFLPDPKKLFNAQLNGVSRAIDFPTGREIDGPGVSALVRACVERHRRSTLQRGKASGQRAMKGSWR